MNKYSAQRYNEDISDLVMMPFEAIEELRRRQWDPSLKRRVETLLNGDIPDYLKGDPIFYIARHVATPNFEMLRFVHLFGDLGYKAVISEDSRGLFVSQNLIKRALCKLPICKRVSQKDKKINELYRYMTIADFSKIDGAIFSEIKTFWGEDLIAFHNRLFKEFGIKNISFPDDADWIDRHHRGNLQEHYKKQLLLFVVHGIFFENYNLNDEHEIHFIREILRPACKYVEESLGYKPIIAQIFPTEPESYNFWISYPLKVMNIVKDKMLKGLDQ